MHSLRWLAVLPLFARLGQRRHRQWNCRCHCASPCQCQRVAGRPIGGRCCERQSQAAGSRVCGAKVCCAGLQAGLARGSSGHLCCLLRLRDPHTKKPFPCWHLLQTGLGLPCLPDLGAPTTPLTFSSTAPTILCVVRDLSTACHEQLTVLLCCTDVSSLFCTCIAQQQPSSAGTRFWCGARRLACAFVLGCCWLGPQPLQSKQQPATSFHPHPNSAPPRPATTLWLQHAGWAIVWPQYLYLRPPHSSRPCRPLGESPSRAATPMSPTHPCEPRPPSMALRSPVPTPTPCARSRTANPRRRSARWSSVEWPRRHGPGRLGPSPTVRPREPRRGAPPPHTRPLTPPRTTRPRRRWSI